MTISVALSAIDQFALDSVDAHTGTDLRERFGPSALNTALVRGSLVRVLPNVYASSVHATSFHVRAKAASLWATAPISGRAALFLWGLVDEPPHIIEVLVPQSRKLHPPGWVRVRRSGTEVSLGRRHGISVVSPAAAVVLGYGHVHKDLRAEVVYGAVRRGLVGAPQLDALMCSLPRVKARESLARRVRAAAGAQSYLEEHALYKVFNTREFAQFVRQHEVVIEGNQFFLDMFDRATKTAVELDGRNGHTNEGRQKNITRDCWVATIGILTLRFSYAHLTERSEWCRQVVREVLNVRSAL